MSQALREYNSIFDEHSLDMLLLPAQMADVASYVDAANASIPVRLDNRTIGTTMSVVSNWGAWKSIPVPKLLVPTGLDDLGRPIGVMLFGRAPPADRMFDDVYAKTYDLPFLYMARNVVNSLYETAPNLQRKHAPLVDDLFA